MRRFGISLIVLSCVWVSSAAAQDAGKQKRADELFEQGRKQLNEAKDDPEKVAAACEVFNEAIKLDPEAPGTMLNLGLCNEKLGKYKTALYWFRKAQARAAETNLPEYKAAAEQHTVDLASKVATIKIAFTTPPPPETKVKIDGEDVSSADYLRAEVDPGDHTLVAGAPGKKIVTQQFTIEGRGGQTITLELVEGDNTIIIDRGAGRRKAAIYTAVGGVVLWGIAGGLSLWARGNYCDQFVPDPAMPNKDTCGEAQFIDMNKPNAVSDANKYRDIARYGGTSIFVVGALAIGGGVALYLTAPEKEKIDRTVFVPTVGPDGVGFAVSGGF